MDIRINRLANWLQLIGWFAAVVYLTRSGVEMGVLYEGVAVYLGVGIVGLILSVVADRAGWVTINRSRTADA